MTENLINIYSAVYFSENMAERLHQNDDATALCLTISQV